MNYLLDTHIYLWHLEANPLLKSSTRTILQNSSHSFYLSTESIREIAIKNRDGKLTLMDTFEVVVTQARRQSGIHLLAITTAHLIRLNILQFPSNHRHPFDHLIICQSIEEDLTLISSDGNFPFYTNQGLKLLVN